VQLYGILAMSENVAILASRWNKYKRIQTCKCKKSQVSNV